MAEPTGDPRHPPATARVSWLSGLAVGVPGGFLLLELPPLGLVVVVAAAALVWRFGRRLTGLGGLLVGIGATGTFFLGRVWVICSAEKGCVAPTIDLFLAIGLAQLAIGLALSAVGIMQSRQN